MKNILLAFLFSLTLPVFCANAQSKPDLAPADGNKLTYDVVVYGDSSGAAGLTRSRGRPDPGVRSCLLFMKQFLDPFKLQLLCLGRGNCIQGSTNKVADNG